MNFSSTFFSYTLIRWRSYQKFLPFWSIIFIDLVFQVLGFVLFLLKRNYMKVFFLLTFVLLIFSACERTSCENAQAATIEDYTGLDGCGLVIKLQNGEVLEPTNLNDFNFTPTDGMKVWVKYHELQNVMSICMVGPIVEIDCISKR